MSCLLFKCANKHVFHFAVESQHLQQTHWPGLEHCEHHHVLAAIFQSLLCFSCFLPNDFSHLAASFSCFGTAFLFLQRLSAQWSQQGGPACFLYQPTNTQGQGHTHISLRCLQVEQGPSTSRGKWFSSRGSFAIFFLPITLESCCF